MLLARKWHSYYLSIRRGITSKSHYEALGVKSNATQAEIKSAYYDMSKLYHPDTNKGSEESLSKFRQINDAYEVLSNINSRKLYDRGLIVGGSKTTLREDVVEDDPTTRFYKKREKRHQVPTTMQGNTFYDFDAWARAHYLYTKNRRSSDKQRYEFKISSKQEIFRRKKYDVPKLMTEGEEKHRT